MRAIKSAAPALRPDETKVTHFTGMRFTNMPVDRFASPPAMRDGRIRIEAPNAESSWTSWKLVKISTSFHFDMRQDECNLQQTAK